MDLSFEAGGHAAPDTLGLRVRRITIPSGDVAFVDEGDGPPVLLLHGAPITSLGFCRVIRGLRDRYRVIAPDLPGFGQSRAGVAFRGSLQEYATSVEELCSALGLARFVLFGCDAGACIGLAAAGAMPFRVAGLVVADAVPFPLVGRARIVKLLLKHVVSSWPARLLNRRLNLLPWLVATVDPFRRPFSAQERAVLAGQYDSFEKRDRILDVFAAMACDDAFMARTALTVAERLADTPALLLFGQFDPVRAAGGVSRYQQVFRRHTVAIIPREKHFPILGAGDDVAKVMREWMGAIAWRTGTAAPETQDTPRDRTRTGLATA